MIHNHLPNSARKILVLMFLIENKFMLASLQIENCKNKRGYLSNKGCLSCTLINTFNDAECGWLLLAELFHSTQKYQYITIVIDNLYFEESHRSK